MSRQSAARALPRLVSTGIVLSTWVALVLVSTGVREAVAWAPDGTPILYANGVVDRPQIVPDGGGGSFACWSDASSKNVLVLRMDANGSPYVGWPKNVAAPASAGNQRYPRMVADGAGGVYVCWEDSRNPVTGIDIYATRLNASGAVVAGWSAGGTLVCGWGQPQTRPNLVLESGGGIIVTWADARSGPSACFPYAQKLNASGVAQWGSSGEPILGGPLFVQVVPVIGEILSDGAGGAYVSYVSADPAAMIGRIGDNAGSKTLWSTTISWTAIGESPVLAPDGLGGVIAAYTEVVGAAANIRALRMGPAGTSMGDVTLCSAAGTQRRPTIAGDGVGGAVVAWDDERTSGTHALYAGRVRIAGSSLVNDWVEIPVAAAMRPLGATNLSLTPRSHDVVADGFGGAWLTWATSTNDVMTARVLCTGAVTSLTTLCADPGVQDSPTSTMPTANSVAVLWRDQRIHGVSTGLFGNGVLATRPAAPTIGVSSGSNTQVITWMGPANDPVLGAPAAFQVRRSNAAITDLNWDAATPVIYQAADLPPGSSYCGAVGGLASCTTYHYALKTIYSTCGVLSAPSPSRSGKTKCAGGLVVSCDPGFMSRSPVTGETANPALTLAFAAPSPSPATASTTFRFTIPSEAAGQEFRLSVFDVAGRQVRLVAAGAAPLGANAFEWNLRSDDGVRVSRGVYFARMSVGGRSLTRLVIVQP